MSNTQLATEMIAAYQRGDQEAVVRMIDPEIEVHGDADTINAGTYHGLEGFQHWSGQWEEAWKDTRYELVQLTELDDGFVVAAVRVTATGRASGIPIKDVYGYLWEIRNGRAVRFHTYVTKETALRRAGELAAGEAAAAGSGDG
jgi:ketosteroid isomerase-like protein